jgi:hypothetical protein
VSCSSNDDGRSLHNRHCNRRRGGGRQSARAGCSVTVALRRRAVDREDAPGPAEAASGANGDPSVPRHAAGKRLRVLDVVPVEEEGSPFTGFLKVEPI